MICRIRAITGEQSDAAPISTPPAAPESQPEQKELYLGLARCPACGSSDLTRVQKKPGTFSAGEWLLRMLLVLSALPCGLVVAVIAAIPFTFLPLSDEVTTTINTITTIGGIVVSCIFGKRIVNEHIRRRRIRKGWIPEPFCCTECQKKFLVKKNR